MACRYYRWASSSPLSTFLPFVFFIFVALFIFTISIIVNAFFTIFGSLFRQLRSLHQLLNSAHNLWHSNNKLLETVSIVSLPLNLLYSPLSWVLSRYLPPSFPLPSSSLGLTILPSSSSVHMHSLSTTSSNENSIHPPWSQPSKLAQGEMHVLILYCVVYF